MLVTCKSVAKQERSGKLRGLPTPPNAPPTPSHPLSTPHPPPTGMQPFLQVV